MAALLILLLSINSLNVFGQGSNEGILRMTFKPFPYRPYEGDYASYSRLGDVELYVINIFTPDIIETYVKSNRRSIEMFGEPGKMGVMLIDSKSGTAGTNQARYFLSDESRRSILDFFDGSANLTVEVHDPRPPYVDVPLPAGKYYLSYSLYFPRAKLEGFNYVCPNYVSKTLNTEVSIQWGPPSVVIYPGQIANIEFAPTRNIGTWEGEFDWKQSPTFWHYVSYLTWSGAVY